MLETGNLLGGEVALEHVGSEGLCYQLESYLGRLDVHPILVFSLVYGQTHEVGKGTGAGSLILIHDDFHALRR